MFGKTDSLLVLLTKVNGIENKRIDQQIASNISFPFLVRAKYVSQSPLVFLP